MRHDLLLAWRVISREPLVMAVATMGLALSIGISALAFTLLDTRFLSGGGIAESHAVSRVALLPSVFSRPTGDSPMQGNWTLVDFDRIRLGANTMALTAAANVRRTLRTSDGSQTAVAGSAVTGNYFEALGAAATTVGSWRPPMIAPGLATCRRPFLGAVAQLVWRERACRGPDSPPGRSSACDRGCRAPVVFRSWSGGPPACGVLGSDVRGG